jgi:acyl-CoA thioesterase
MTKDTALPARISQFARSVGLKFSRSESGTPQCILEIHEGALNVNGTVHGGALYTLIDVSMGWLLFDHLRKDERIATVEMKINYLTAVSSGVLVAEAKLIHRSKRLAVLESQIECEGCLIAKAMGTFYISTIRRTDG